VAQWSTAGDAVGLMGGRRTELVESLVESLVGDGGHGEPHCRVVAQHGVEVFDG